jgi:hypothetical protein
MCDTVGGIVLYFLLGSKVGPNKSRGVRKGPASVADGCQTRDSVDSLNSGYSDSFSHGLCLISSYSVASPSSGFRVLSTVR